MSEPGILSKGAVLKQLDRITNDPNRRGAFLNTLKYSERDYVQILIEYELINAAEATFLRNTWFPPNWEDPNSRCLWPEHQPLEPIIRQSLIAAIELATRPPEGNKPARILPIDTYLVCAGDQFEVAICLSEHQVTRITLAPAVPQDEYERQRHPKQLAKLTVAGPIWIVKHGKESIEPWEIEENRDDKSQVVTVWRRTMP